MRPLGASRRPVVVASAASREDGDRPPAPVRAAAAAVVTAALAAALPSAATAASSSKDAEVPFHGWRTGSRPRRHKRTMGDGRFSFFESVDRRLYRREGARGEGRRSVDTLTAATNPVDRAADAAVVLAGDAAAAASRAARVWRRAAGWAKKVFGRSSTDSVNEFTVSASAAREVAPARGVRPTSFSAPSTETTAVIGWTAAAVVAVGLVVAVARSAAAASRRGPGRWVLDRSLGGRRVWLPDPVLNPPAARQCLNDDLFLEDEPPAARAAAPLRPRGPTLPTWWAPPAARRAAAAPAAEATARVILRSLEASKLAGADYDVSALASLRLALADSGGAVAPRSTNVRDAILRAAAEAAAAAAASGGSPALRGVTPAALVAGLTADLGAAPGDGANMALAAVAAKARSLLVAAAAETRAAGGSARAALLTLASLAALLTALPLPLDAPQTPMVAAALASRASVGERRALFEAYRDIDPPTAATVAAMLGFDPDLVMADAGRG